MEWQAGYACGALLMPGSYLGRLAADYRSRHGVLSELQSDAPDAAGLIETLSRAFNVSGEAARVRLLKAKHLVEASPGEAIFHE
jgi:alpha-D-ribose 1-methylphosphonate 5-triphosphate diphosphatase PhnM